MAALPSHGLRRLNSHQWLQTLRKTPSSSSHSLSSLPSLCSSPSSSSSSIEDSEDTQFTTKPNDDNKKTKKKIESYFPKRGQSLELVCESLAFKGKGVCKVANSGFVVMCDRALPGERLVARITRKKDNYAEMEFSFSNQTWVPRDLLQDKQSEQSEQSDAADYALGLHAPGFFDKVLNVNKCLLQSEPANEVLKAIQDCWRDPKLGLSPYNVHSHAGYLKHLMLRTGRDVNTGLLQLMVNFVTSSHKPELLNPLVEKISAIPEVVSIVNNVNTSVGNTSVGEDEFTLYGKSTITEILRGLVFQISANSFFQTNSHQAEVLYRLIEDYADLKGDGSEIVLDLFCGTGTIGLTLARKARRVYGYEVVPQAISDACRNAKMNNINNATFVQGDLNKIDLNFGKNFPKPDIIISDPNRPGMHMKLIKYLLKLRAPRIIYVSCNPATCARDLDYLCHGVAEQNIEGCYKLRSLQPVDMFPHTPHIECVCLLELQ
ncbi:hypothetical protein TEA_028306 [Camellia sinensis var. sinensis]|uniref:TRAM domain-containing protein n=1 Tax=Camellia sinensis var. sinensis TaxID=542762 RepID=A0A4V3WLQ4_CAMSN|nr:hypothetical protein TEA_028306 [Camellia sinensis var. sinensis]